jgi:transcription initiation factor IIF auxiliary subunit
MAGIQGRLVMTLALGLLFAAVATPSLAAPTVQNTSTYAGGGRWDWKIFIVADAQTLQEIECVEYTLHPTFPQPVQRVCNRPDTGFAYSSNGWGTFMVKVTIQYKSGRVENLEHALVFEQRSAPTALSVTAKNWAREIEPGWWEWGIHMEGAPAELNRIRCVEYTLHPSFPNPVRVVCSRNDRFLLTARGWGTFEVKIKVMLKDGSVVPFSHQLEFR